MKKILFLAMAAAALVSCSQNEEFENAAQKAEIKFNSVVKAGTKAAITTTENLERFYVQAYRTTDPIATASALGEAFMSNVEVSKKNSNWEYTGGPYYWPVTDKVQFFATAPSQSLNVVDGTKYPQFDYTIKTVKSQEDLIAANQTDKVKSSGAVVFPFKHLLTQVNFSIKGATPGFTYTVSKLVIKGAKDKATFTFDGTDKVGAWSTPTASSDNPAVTYEYEPVTAVSVAPTEADKDAVTKFEDTNKALFMLMPQTVTNNVTLDISYTVAPTTALDSYVYDDTKTVKLTGSWDMSKNVRYTLILTNDGSPIQFGVPSVSGWTDEAGTGDEPVEQQPTV